MSSIWNDKYDFRPRFIALHSIQLSLYYSHFEITKFSQYKYFIDQIFIVEKQKQKGFSSHFVSKSEMMRYSYRAKMVRFKTEMMQFRT